MAFNVNNIGLDAAAYNAGIGGAYGPGSFSVYGNTYIIWGTDWVSTGLIIVSATYKDRIIDLTVEQGAGFSAMFGMLNDGKDIDIEAIDASNVAQWSLSLNPFTIVAPTGSLNVILTGNSVNYARKREGIRTGNFKSFTGFNLSSGTPV